MIIPEYSKVPGIACRKEVKITSFRLYLHFNLNYQKNSRNQPIESNANREPDLIKVIKLLPDHNDAAARLIAAIIRFRIQKLQVLAVEQSVLMKPLCI